MERGSYTDNYNLLKPAREDFYSVEDFNQNADIVDGELKKLNDKDKSLDNRMDSVDSELKNLSDEDKNINNKISSLANVAKSGSYNDLMDKPKSLERTKLTKTDDLNNVTEAGGYYFASSDVPQNVPQGLNNNCVLDVSYSKDINTIIQILYKLLGGIPEIYIRRRLNSSWSDWLKYSNDSMSMNYNNLSNKPASLPANGGNSDTVDGKHSSDFINKIDLGYTETDINTLVSTGFYKCVKFYCGENGKTAANRGMPAISDGQGMLEVRQYAGEGYVGKDHLWINQILYLPGRQPFFRYTADTTVSDWIQIKDYSNDISKIEKTLREDFNQKTEIIDSKLKNLTDEDKNINNKISSLASVAKSGSYNDLTDKPKSLERTKLTKADNLNNVTEAGGYYFASGDVPQNVPQGLNNNCVLDVSYSKDINTIIQILYKLLGGIPEIYIRRRLNSSWSDWLKYSNDSMSMNYNNLSNKPASLPANGGNSDTVDGKHSSDFINKIDLGYTETDINTLVSTGFYKCVKFYCGENGKTAANRGMPAISDGQGMLEVRQYAGEGYVGKDHLWINQILYLPGRQPFFRYTADTTVSDWIQIKDYSNDISEIAKKLRTEIIIKT